MVRINQITEQERDTIRRIEDNCRKLHLPSPPKTTIVLSVYTPDGQQTLALTRLAKSWTRNGYNHMCIHLMGSHMNIGSGFGAGKLGVKDNDTTVYSAAYVTSPFGDVASGCYLGNDASAANPGIIIGTGTGAENFEGYVIGTKINHGTGAGQMHYHAQATAGISYDAGTKVFTAIHRRSFDNFSGAAITVAESAWYAHFFNAVPQHQYLMLSRDLFSPAIEVANRYRLTVDYQLQITYPA